MSSIGQSLARLVSALGKAWGVPVFVLGSRRASFQPNVLGVAKNLRLMEAFF